MIVQWLLTILQTMQNLSSNSPPAQCKEKGIHLQPNSIAKMGENAALQLKSIWKIHFFFIFLHQYIINYLAYLNL